MGGKGKMGFGIGFVGPAELQGGALAKHSLQLSSAVALTEHERRKQDGQ